MEAIRKEITNQLLNDILLSRERAGSVDIFCNFIKALVWETELHRPEVAEDEAEAQVDLAEEYRKEIGALFKRSGDQQEKLNKIFVKLERSKR